MRTQKLWGMINVQRRNLTGGANDGQQQLSIGLVLDTQTTVLLLLFFFLSMCDGFQMVLSLPVSLVIGAIFDLQLAPWKQTVHDIQHWTILFPLLLYYIVHFTRIECPTCMVPLILRFGINPVYIYSFCCKQFS